MQNAAKQLAGYTLGGADILRRAMGKKKPSEMAKQREIFVEGSKVTNDIDDELANKIFDKIAGFAIKPWQLGGLCPGRLTIIIGLFLKCL